MWIFHELYLLLLFAWPCSFSIQQFLHSLCLGKVKLLIVSYTNQHLLCHKNLVHFKYSSIVIDRRGTSEMCAHRHVCWQHLGSKHSFLSYYWFHTPLRYLIFFNFFLHLLFSLLSSLFPSSLSFFSVFILPSWFWNHALPFISDIDVRTMT